MSSTHEVFNQVPPQVDYDAANDPALLRAPYRCRGTLHPRALPRGPLKFPTTLRCFVSQVNEQFVGGAYSKSPPALQGRLRNMTRRSLR